METLAIVAGEKITEKELNAFLQSVPREQQAYISNPQFREQALEQLIALYMFAKEGEELKFEETEEYKAVIANARKDILAQMAMREAMKAAVVTEEEMKAYYDANQAQFMKGETINAKHILVADEEKCNEVLKAIEGGLAFEEAAQQNSTCPSGQKGGDLGSFGKGQMVKEFEEAAFAAEIGQVVGPVKTQFGYHLIKVEAKNEATTSSFEEVQESIRRMLVQQKQNAVYGEKVAALKEKYLEK